MDITICDNLKQLRKMKNNTQEDLAEFLTISISAVSKWERGESYPDIELLPRIAVFYDTTVDDLLGVGEVRKNQKIDKYRNQMYGFYKSGDTLANVELWRHAAKEFPNDNNVMMYLITALTNAAWGLSINDKDNESKKSEYFKETIEIGEALIAKANDQHIIYVVMSRLSKVYKELGEADKAVKIANRIPTMCFNKEESLLQILEDAELKTHFQEYLLNLIISIHNVMNGVLSCDYDKEQIICIFEKAIQMIKLFFEDEDYGSMHTYIRSWYTTIAIIYAGMNDDESAIKNLTSAAEHAIAYDLLEEDVPHTSLLFNTLKSQKHGKTYMTNESQLLLNAMEMEHFNFCRYDERFIEIHDRLTICL